MVESHIYYDTIYLHIKVINNNKMILIKKYYRWLFRSKHFIIFLGEILAEKYDKKEDKYKL